ncbi:MAG: UvrD-helicase domain-containing protein [Patescibacteria group bacterium]
MQIDEIKHNLNPEQLEAVEHTEGPLVIVAGAGTGKTTVITKRVANLILTGKAKSDEILAVTFTDKAAGEMEDRIDKLMPYGYIDLWVYTFHALCERILHDYGLEIGLADDFKLISSVEQSLLIRKNLDEFKLTYYKPVGNPEKFIEAMVSHFSRCKDEVVSPDDYLRFAAEFEFKNKGTKDEAVQQEIIRLKEIAQAYDTYQQLLLKNSYLDFGDLINYTLKLFRERPNILKHYREQFKYILVDEFQDTNYAQYELIRLLAQPRNNVTVCFDDDQSIYKFRGASVSNVLQFQKDFPASRYVCLTQNYRSYQEILDLSYNFIQQNNPNRLEYELQHNTKNSNFKNFSKKLIAQNVGQAEIETLFGRTLQGEVERVVQKIIDLKSDQNLWSDFAILIRANSQAEEFINVLERQNIPYQFLASSGLYNKPIILDILAYLKLLDNYHESPALYRIFNSPVFKIKTKDLINLNYWADRKSWSLYETLEKESALENISHESREIIIKLLGLIEKHSQEAVKSNVSQMIFDFIEESGYLKLLAQNESKENIEKVAQLNQFFKKVSAFEKNNLDKTTKAFMHYMDLVVESGDQGAGVIDLEQSGPETVKIMTIHSSKGLEFDYVFIPNLVDLRFPSTSRKDPIELPNGLVKEIVPEGDLHLEEERRLMYVAMTRAKKGLFLAWGKDYGGARDKKPSRFLQELDLVVEDDREPIKNEIEKLYQKNRKVNVNDDEELNFTPPDKYSFTQLKAFESCPLQYKFQHVFHIPVRGKWNFSFGKTLHATLEKMFKQIIKDKYELKISLEKVFELYEESWIDDWYVSKKQRLEAKELGREILSNLYVKLREEGVPETLHLELPFSFKIGKYTLKGKIDRVDKIGSNKLRLVDYKTGSPKLEKDLGFDDKEQLFIYQMAIKELFRDEVEELSFVYLNDGTQVNFIGEQKDLDKMENKIVELIEKINEGKFEPTPDPFKCKYCDFKNICQFKK